MSDGVLTVRRSTFHAGMLLVMALALLALAGLFLANSLAPEGSPLAGALLLAMAAFYAWHCAAQLWRREPQVEIGPEGLALPGARAAPIAWDRVRAIARPTGLLGLAGPGGPRIDVETDLETVARMRFGWRFAGDHVVRRRGSPTGFSIMASGLDHGADAIHAAILRHWRPVADGDDGAAAD